MGRTRTIHELGFAPSDQQRISGAMRRTTDVCTYRRLQGVLLVARGYSITEVTRITTAKSAALYDWVRRYLRTHKPESLHNAARSGRPPAAAAITSARIVCEFRRDPLALGYSTTGWTVSLLAAHLSRKYDCPLSTRTLRQRMRAVGLRWKRPRYVYADKDPHRTQKNGVSFAA